jgi:hypothetical protein
MSAELASKRLQLLSQPFHPPSESACCEPRYSSAQHRSRLPKIRRA